MRSYGQLWNQIVSEENILAGWKLFRRYHARKAPTLKFQRDLEHNLAVIRRQLVERTWEPSNYHQFKVYEPKPRTISSVRVHDRVVHHALCNVVAPLMDRRFIVQSYACRKGKGSHMACRRARELSAKHRYFLKLDVRHYFESVDHGILLSIVNRMFREREVRTLCEKIITHPIPNHEPGRALPIGNLTSQWFANLYLDGLDHFAVEGLRLGSRYLRYMDDMLIFTDTKEEAWAVLAEIRDWLRRERRLALKEPATIVAPVSEGVPFLGLRIWPNAWRFRHSRLKRTRRSARRYYRMLVDFGRGDLTNRPQRESGFGRGDLTNRPQRPLYQSGPTMRGPTTPPHGDGRGDLTNRPQRPLYQSGPTTCGPTTCGPTNDDGPTNDGGPTTPPDSPVERKFQEVLRSMEGTARWYGFKGIFMPLEREFFKTGFGSTLSSGASRVIRGGNYNSDNAAAWYRSGSRNRNNGPTNSNANNGFRLSSTCASPRGDGYVKITENQRLLHKSHPGNPALRAFAETNMQLAASGRVDACASNVRTAASSKRPYHGALVGRDAPIAPHGDGRTAALSKRPYHGALVGRDAPIAPHGDGRGDLTNRPQRPLYQSGPTNDGGPTDFGRGDLTNRPPRPDSPATTAFDFTETSTNKKKEQTQ